MSAGDGHLGGDGDGGRVDLGLGEAERAQVVALVLAEAALLDRGERGVEVGGGQAVVQRALVGQISLERVGLGDQTVAGQHGEAGVSLDLLGVEQLPQVVAGVLGALDLLHAGDEGPVGRALQGDRVGEGDLGARVLVLGGRGERVAERGELAEVEADDRLEVGVGRVEDDRVVLLRQRVGPCRRGSCCRSSGPPSCRTSDSPSSRRCSTRRERRRRGRRGRRR
jgi:hypothetical protein